MTAIQELGDARAGESEADEGILTTSTGRRIGYLARGPEDGRRVIYLHGAPGSRREQLLIPDEALQRFGVRLISFDRPGYGHTNPLNADRVARVSDVLAACDGLGIRSFPMIAVSSGGSYAVSLAAVAPERVERVVLCSAQMPYDDESALTELQPHQRALLPALREPSADLIAGLEQARAQLLENPILALAPHTATLTDPERTWYERSHVRNLFVDEIREGMRAQADGLLGDLLNWPCPFEADISQIRCPIRAVHGTADDWEPLPNLTRVLTQLQDTQLILFDGFNHLGPLMQPDLLLSLASSTQ